MTDIPDYPAQAEHTHISTALELETLDVTLFRSKTLWIPSRARGVFGGQVISQAIVSATNCVDKSYGLHVSHILIYCPWQVRTERISMPSLYMWVVKSDVAPNIQPISWTKCYFLLRASAAVPIIYYVERIFEGRSYTTRTLPVTNSEPPINSKYPRSRQGCPEWQTDLRTHMLFPQARAVPAITCLAYAAQCTEPRGVWAARNHLGSWSYQRGLGWKDQKNLPDNYRGWGHDINVFASTSVLIVLVLILGTDKESDSF